MMLQLSRTLCTLSFLSLCVMPVGANDIRVYEPGERPNDRRLEPLKDLNGYFPFAVPDTRAQWEKRANELKRQVLVATGIWPLPPRTAINPVIHGKVQRDGFTVEKVYFESIPNHFVTGLLFRPDDGQVDVKRPAVLCPHGHGGRLQDYGASQLRQLIADGAERFEESGRFPKLARCAHLARMGCVTFIFDMLGYADSQQISRDLAHGFSQQRPDFEGPESWGLFSAQAEMRLQSIMGIQTWNSIRCLDFLEQLPDVDSSRIAVTGGSGGGTQTILLCAIDDRPVAGFPNGMVSTSMQGGCTCENCTLLRVGSGNVELAALFAPKPQAMTAADDWTKEMMTKGYPQLQQVYELFGAKDNVYCRELIHFPHNYNYVSRATMYKWFNRHLQLGLEEPFLEEDYPLLSPGELQIWNDEHPQPPGGETYERELTKYLANESDKQIDALRPHDQASLAEFRRIVGGAFRTILGRAMPDPHDIERTKLDEQQHEGHILFKGIVRLKSEGEELPVVTLWPSGTPWNGDVVLWIDGQGKRGLFDESGKVIAPVQKLLQGGVTVAGVDLFQQGEFLTDNQALTQQRVVGNPREAAAYTFCYNHTLFAHRVHDVMTLVSYIRGYQGEEKPRKLKVVGTNGAGPIVAAARVIAGNMIDQAVIDTQGFRFTNIRSYRDADFLPGVVKYGDLPALLALGAPHEVLILGEENLPSLVQAAYSSADAVQRARSMGDMQAAVSRLVE